jgi:DNA-binding XRE family transcriptional regulator
MARLRAAVVGCEPEAAVTPIFRSVRGDIQFTGPRRPKGTTAMGLKAFREALGMSADDVAFAIGLRLGEIERIEEGRVQPSLNVLAHLRDVLGADLNEIIGVAVPLGRLRMNGPGFAGLVTFGFIDKLGGEDAVRRIVKPVRGKLRAQAIQNWHERRRVPHYAISQMLAYAADNGITLSHEDFIPQRLNRDGSTEWLAATLYCASADKSTPVRRSYPA